MSRAAPSHAEKSYVVPIQAMARSTKDDVCVRAVCLAEDDDRDVILHDLEVRIPVSTPIRRVNVELDRRLGLHLHEALAQDLDSALILVECAVRVLRDEVEEAVDLRDLLRLAAGDVLELGERDLSGARGRRGEAKVFERSGEREERGVAVDAYVEERPSSEEDDGPDDAPAAERGWHSSGCSVPVSCGSMLAGPSFLAATDREVPKGVGRQEGALRVGCAAN